MPKPPTESDPPSLPAAIDEHSKVYIGIIGASATSGAILGGPPGALIGAGVGVAGCTAHYVRGKAAKRKD